MAFTRLHLPPVRTCPAAKRRYYSEAEARKACETLAADNRRKGWPESPGESLIVYHCLECRAWHTGHREVASCCLVGGRAQQSRSPGRC